MTRICCLFAQKIPTPKCLIKSNFFVYQNFVIKIERGCQLDPARPKMHNVSEITGINSMSNLRFAEHDSRRGVGWSRPSIC